MGLATELVALALGALVSAPFDDERGRVDFATGLSLVVTRILSSLGHYKHARVRNFCAHGDG
jgi:hypothetical protein